MNSRLRRIAFISTMQTVPWGGSEELWGQSAQRLMTEGHTVSASVQHWPKRHPRVQQLLDRGCHVVERRSNRLVNLGFKVARRDPGAFQIKQFLKSARPDLVVFSFGSFAEQLGWCNACQALGLPFAIVVQSAAENFWPNDQRVELIWEVCQAARKIFFVSRGNQELAETMLARQLPQACVISNPFNVDFSTTSPYPPVTGALNLACVARLDPVSKGQDLLLKVLALEKWRSRNLKVSFFGQGGSPKSLRALAQKLDVRNVEFCGHVNGTSEIWKNHHLLVLPSRYEGLPISLVEAMLCARAAIVTDVAGNAEVIDDNQTGFVARAPTVALLDEAMERAWNRREEWAQMGSEAARKIRKLVPEDPVGIFTNHLLGLLDL